MREKILKFTLIGAIVLIIITILVSNDTYDNPNSAVDDSSFLNDNESNVNLNTNDTNIEYEIYYPFDADGVEINGNEELDFGTSNSLNYFSVSFSNTGNNPVSIWIDAVENPKQYYKLEIPAQSEEEVYFDKVAPDHYFLDITGDRGGECKGILSVIVSNGPFD